MYRREAARLFKNLDGIRTMDKQPAAVFIIDVKREHNAVAEGRRLKIPMVAIVDTNSDPRKVDFPIPANDDASKSISIIIETMVNAIEEGLVERQTHDRPAQLRHHLFQRLPSGRPWNSVVCFSVYQSRLQVLPP